MQSILNFKTTEGKNIFDTAIAMADEASDVILPYFRSKYLTVKNKANIGFDPVTEADKNAEKAMINVLKQMRPSDAVLGEEFGELKGKGLYRWVLDPIDGTRGFISGTPTWGTLISVERKGYGPIFGIIDQPYIGERYLGGMGLSEVITRNAKNALKTSKVEKIEDAILLSTFPEIGTEQEYNAFMNVAKRTKLTRYGLDCYGYALVAMGTADLVIEAGLSSYDIQAPICIIEAAGGAVSTWDGKPAFNGGRIVAASNKKLLKKALDCLNS